MRVLKRSDFGPTFCNSFPRLAVPTCLFRPLTVRKTDSFTGTFFGHKFRVCIASLRLAKDSNPFLPSRDSSHYLDDGKSASCIAVASRYTPSKGPCCTCRLSTARSRRVSSCLSKGVALQGALAATLASVALHCATMQILSLDFLL